MKKKIIILLAGFIVFLLISCNTPTESMGQSNPVLNFDVQYSRYLKVTVNNLIGDRIVTLIEGELRAGGYSIPWDGKNNKGDYVDEGFYHFSIYFAGGKLWKTKLIYYKRN